MNAMNEVKPALPTVANAGVRRMVYAALYLALAMVLPFLTGQIPQIGAMLCPMHLPALLCGFVCGGPWGLAVGAIAPLLRMQLFGMPPLPVAIAMTFELSAYGLVSGLLYKRLPKKPVCIFVSLLTAMIVGRAVWGVAQLTIFGLRGDTFTMPMFLAGAFTTAVPGIILQLVLIPAMVMALCRSGLMLND